MRNPTNNVSILLFTLILVFAFLTSTATACRCWRDGNNELDERVTEYCCSTFLRGTYDNALKDCQAHSISEEMSKFHGCCRDHFDWSDCKH